MVLGGQPLEILVNAHLRSVALHARHTSGHTALVSIRAVISQSGDG
jgi:hypothetical protein